MDEQIKIFVSNRIDVDSFPIPNPLYIPVRCGAVYDKRQQVKIAGDNTGENISVKRLNYNELTVQYWAWKNQKADYYGLCHYRRFLAFSCPKHFYKNDYGLLEEPFLSIHTARKYGLLNPGKMKRTITSADLIVMQGLRLNSVRYYSARNINTIHDLWIFSAIEGNFFSKEMLDKMLSILHQIHPEYSTAADSYLKGDIHIGYNVFVMKKSLFQQLCEFQFPILSALEKLLEQDENSKKYPRTLGYMGEILFGIFVWKSISEGKYRIKELPLVYFYHTERGFATTGQYFKRICLSLIVSIHHRMPHLINVLFPLGSRRRSWVKRIFYSIKTK